LTDHYPWQKIKTIVGKYYKMRNQFNLRFLASIPTLATSVLFTIAFTPGAIKVEAAVSDTKVSGILISEGVECPAMRGNDGKLYTLVGDLRGFKAGDTILVKGEFLRKSNCMQGQAIRLKLILRN